jgi:hypothetical protein
LWYHLSIWTPIQHENSENIWCYST